MDHDCECVSVCECVKVLQVAFPLVPSLCNCFGWWLSFRISTPGVRPSINIVVCDDYYYFDYCAEGEQMVGRGRNSGVG